MIRPHQQVTNMLGSFLIISVLMIGSNGLAPAETLPGQGVGSQGEMQSTSAFSSISAAAGNQFQSPFLGSVPSGKASPEVFQLSIKEAIERGLKCNLGLLINEQGTRSARGQRWKALSDLLPNVSTSTRETVQQVNLAAFGINLPNAPRIVGPFSVFDTRALLSQPVLDFQAIENARAAAENVMAAEYTYKNARDLVVLVVGNSYLQVVARAARVEAAQAQEKTAQALYDKARDLQKAGLTPGIDVLRAQVELKSRQQQLISAENEFAKQKLNLARVIGLPVGQEFVASDKIPYAPLDSVKLEEALQRAYSSRADYQSVLAQLRAAELARKAAAAERYPTLAFNADYGDIGVSPGNSHGTFTVAGTLKIPIFQGGKVRGDMLQADAVLQQRKSQLEDLRARIDYEVRTALMDLKAAADQVEVAKSSVELANQTLTQAQDRFAAGVVDNLEVVEAQETVANAQEAYISSLYAHNLAKVSLARAVGIAEEAVMQYLGGK